MSDARRKAEEALAIAASRFSATEACKVLEAALRALLAEPAPAAGLRCALPEGQCCHQRATTADVPDSCRVDEDGCCVVCGRDVMGCYACSHAAGKPAPASFRREYLGRWVDNPADTPAPASDAVAPEMDDCLCCGATGYYIDRDCNGEAAQRKCDVCDGTGEVSPPAPDAVAEAAELRRVLSLYDEWNRTCPGCEPAYCQHLAPLVRKLAALDARRRG